MRVAQVSKATATRKLARLAEAGLLQRHGSGRATCYLPPARKSHTAVGPRLDSAALQARLTALTPRFSTSHGVERFEVRALFRRQEPVEAQQGGVLGGAQETPDGGMRFDVFVVFRRPPDLAGFLEIESALRDATRTNLNLVL